MKPTRSATGKVRTKTAKLIGEGATGPAVVQTRQNTKPTEEQVRARAYELFLARGAAHGADLQDWFTAERQLRSQM
jgi:Protein of unknown function (DUF2934)